MPTPDLTVFVGWPLNDAQCIHSVQGIGASALQDAILCCKLKL